MDLLDADLEHSLKPLKRQKNMLCLSLHFICFCFQDLALGILKMINCLCFCDVLQPAIKQFVPVMI